MQGGGSHAPGVLLHSVDATPGVYHRALCCVARSAPSTILLEGGVEVCRMERWRAAKSAVDEEAACAGCPPQGGTGRRQCAQVAGFTTACFQGTVGCIRHWHPEVFHGIRLYEGSCLLAQLGCADQPVAGQYYERPRGPVRPRAQA